MLPLLRFGAFVHSWFSFYCFDNILSLFFLGLVRLIYWWYILCAWIAEVEYIRARPRLHISMVQYWERHSEKSVTHSHANTSVFGWMVVDDCVSIDWRSRVTLALRSWGNGTSIYLCRRNVDELLLPSAAATATIAPWSSRRWWLVVVMWLYYRWANDMQNNILFDLSSWIYYISNNAARLVREIRRPSRTRRSRSKSSIGISGRSTENFLVRSSSSGSSS